MVAPGTVKEEILVKLWLFWIFWSIDALIGAIAVVFFLVGLTNGTVAAFNMGIWIAILAALAVIIGGSLGLKAAGHPGLGAILCLVLAVPGLCSGLLILLFSVSNTSWN